MVETTRRRDAVCVAARAWRVTPRDPRRELDLRIAVDRLNEHTGWSAS